MTEIVSRKKDKMRSFYNNIFLCRLLNKTVKARILTLVHLLALELLTLTIYSRSLMIKLNHIAYAIFS